jgi:lysophospholipase L1-like esterase
MIAAKFPNYYRWCTILVLILSVVFFQGCSNTESPGDSSVGEDVTEIVEEETDSENDEAAGSEVDETTGSEDDETAGSEDDETAGSEGDEPAGSEDNKTPGSEDDEPAGSEDGEPAGSEDDEATGSEDDDTAGSEDDEATGSEDDETTGSEDDETAGSEDDETDDDEEANGNLGVPNPMPVISNDVPAYTNSGATTRPNNGIYEDYCWVSAADLPVWLAYDLSTVPGEQRGRVLVHWINDTYAYFEGVTRSPGVYTIDAHASDGGTTPPAADDPGWVTLAAVTEDDPNIYHSRQHVVNMTYGDTVYNWIRLHVTQLCGATESLNINMDVHDAHLGYEDSWFFAGDSITAAAMRQHENGGTNFAQTVNETLPGYFPAQENAGRGNWTTIDAAPYIPQWLEDFPGRYVALSYGTNDCNGGGVTVETFYDQYESMVQSVLAAGKVPIIPTIAWYNISTNASLPSFNQALETLKTAYPQILDGPDLYTYFYNHPDLISADNLHPSAEGRLEYRRLWAEKMVEIVYDGEPADPDTQAPTAPDGLAAITLEYDRVGIAWDASTDNTGVTGYIIYRDAAEVGRSYLTSYTDTGLDPETTYSYTVRAIDIASNRSDMSASLMVTTDVLPPPLPRITVNGTELQADASPIYMCGANTPWDRHNGTWNNFGGAYDQDWWDDHYSRFNANGLNSSRVWITCSGEVGIIIDETGHVSGATDQHWQDLDSFFEIAQNRRVYIMATLISFDHFSDAYTTYERWRNWIASDDNIDSYIENYLIPFVERYGDYTALWSIDLINEPDWATDTEAGTIDWARFQNFFAKAAKAIHDNSDVLVTVGTAVIKYNSETTPGAVGNMVSDTALQAQLNDPGARLDFWSPHWYDWMDPYWDTPMYVTPAAFHLDNSRPAVLGETPATGTDGNTLEQDIESAYTNGWAGILPWTSNGVDNHGGWEEVSTAAGAFVEDHFSAVFPDRSE